MQVRAGSSPVIRTKNHSVHKHAVIFYVNTRDLVPARSPEIIGASERSRSFGERRNGKASESLRGKSRQGAGANDTKPVTTRFKSCYPHQKTEYAFACSVFYVNTRNLVPSLISDILILLLGHHLELCKSRTILYFHGPLRERRGCPEGAGVATNRICGA